MGTCEQQMEQQEQTQRDRMNFEENNLTITGPPASRNVIDNLKKLLVQRQHSRESDTENNKNTARSNSGSASDAAFYSQFSTSSSDSDDSDDYMIFQELSNEASTNGNGHGGRRRHRRRRSYSSSSSSSPSPVARNRRKVTRVNVTLANSIGTENEISKVDSSSKCLTTATPADTLQKNHQSQNTSGAEVGVGAHNHNTNKGEHEHDSANSTSSHKDSSSEDDHQQQQQQGLSSSAEVVGAGPVLVGSRCPKLKSRRDRDRKRKRSELSHSSHHHRRPKLLRHNVEEEKGIQNQKDNGNVEDEDSSISASVAGATGGLSSENTESVPTTTSLSPETTAAAATAD